MNCPACGLYHPAFYERCIACGMLLKPTQTSQDNADVPPQVDPRSSLARIRFRDLQDAEEMRQNSAPQRPNLPSQTFQRLQAISNKRGFFVALLILVVFAGATAFFLGRSPDDKRLLEQGKQQLSLGQYAFAVQTLSKAAALRANDPNVYLALARAYIGVDQVTEAWGCITHAQQLGVGVIADPALASELANYYKQHGQLEKAIDLLRPLANAAIPGKKAELADLDALRGDDCIEQGKLDEAKRLWEEVQTLNEGVRSTEAKSRLATIYLKLVDIAYGKGEDAKALDYLNKLNGLEENPRNYILAADICEHGGKLDEAINQVQKALKLTTDDQTLKNKLAQLYLQRGKQVIQTGDTTTGYAYFQQANSLDDSLGFPPVAIKNLSVSTSGGKAKIAGELWNPNDKSLNSLSIKIQLSDDSRGITLWQKEQRVIDDFVPPLPSQQSKPFNFSDTVPTHGQENISFKVYIDGAFYGTYPLKAGSRVQSSTSENQISIKEIKDLKESKLSKTVSDKSVKEEIKNDIKHSESENKESKGETDPELSKTNSKQSNENESSATAEEKTMKDLDF
jgi:tetratricopeptide (TPR) repeat protein